MANRIFQLKAKVIKNINVAPKYYKIVLSCPYVACAAQPGQFVMLRLSDSYQPLLRRPFSIHRIAHSSQFTAHRKRKKTKADCIEILYKVVGKGTEILSQKKPGEYLDVLGPLGNGFSILDSRYSIIAGGGIGVAPLLFLAERLSTVNCELLTVLIGANTKKEILCKKEFAKLDCNVKISTDDGSAGFKGKVTDLLMSFLSTVSCELLTIYACGPKPMLKVISAISRQYNIPAQISLEEHMACGIGVCLGCAVNTKEGYKRICKEGPVFDTSTINFNG